MATEKMEVEDEEDGERDELFLPQQITSCLPLASMAQKNPLGPNAAEIGAIDPNPDAKTKKRCKKTQRVGRNLQDLKRVESIPMIWGSYSLWWVAEEWIQQCHGLKTEFETRRRRRRRRAKMEKRVMVVVVTQRERGFGHIFTAWIKIRLVGI